MATIRLRNECRIRRTLFCFWYTGYAVGLAFGVALVFEYVLYCMVALMVILCMLLKVVLVRLIRSWTSVLRLCCSCAWGLWGASLLKKVLTRLLKLNLLAKLGLLVCNGLLLRLHTRCPLGLESILQVVAILPNCLRAAGLGPILGRSLCVSCWQVCPTLLGSVLCGILSNVQQLAVMSTLTVLSAGVIGAVDCVRWRALRG